MQPYNLPAAVPVVFGLGRLDDLGKLAAKRLGPEQCLLLVSDPFAVSSGLAGRVIQGLEEANHKTALFSDIASDPREGHVDACAAAARDFGATCRDCAWRRLSHGRRQTGGSRRRRPKKAQPPMPWP